MFPRANFLTKMLVGGTQELTGVSVGDVEIVSSRKRNATCPKCGQVVSVPDTDDNDQEECPSCHHVFYPFGVSRWAQISFWLAMLLLPAPFALLTGTLAVKDIKANRGKHGLSRAKFGVVVGWVGVVIWIAISASKPLLLIVPGGVCWYWWYLRRH